MRKLSLIVGLLLLFVPAISFSQSSDPVLIGSTSTNNLPTAVAVQNNYAYVTSESGKLQVFNISNPASPTLVDSVSTGTDPSGIVVQGNYAYVIDEVGGVTALQVFNISTPTSPSLVDTDEFGGGYSIYDSIAIQNNDVYVLNYAGDTMQIFDVSNPASPALLSTNSTSFNNYIDPARIVVQNNYAYVVEDQNNVTSNVGTMLIFNVSNPASPTLVGNAPSNGYPWGIAVQNNYAYVIDYNNQTLQIFNVSNPASSTPMGSVSTGNGPYGVVVQNNYAYVVNSPDSTLQVFNISNPASPTLVDSVSTGSFPWGMAIQNNDIYVLNYHGNTMQIFGSPTTPTCTVAVSQTTIPYDYNAGNDGSGATVSYSSSNATLFNISGPGYVTPNISSSFVTSTAGSYTGYVTDSSGNEYACSPDGGTLTVTRPPLPTASIAASSTSIQAGQSTNITADFPAEASTNPDPFTDDNIDSPLGTGLGATTDPDASKTISFSTTTPGTYTFYAVASTTYYDWNQYASTTVTVIANPSCTIGLSPTTISPSQSSTLTYSSSNATSFSIDNIAGPLTPDTTNQFQVSPTHSTDYTGTASEGGVTTQCTAPGTSPAGTLTVACTPAYSCSGNQIQYTNSSCQTSNYGSACVPPQYYCQAGASSCQSSVITFNQTGNQTGQLRVAPYIVSSRNTTQVYWSVSNAENCTVQGSNGDSWTGLASPSNGETSSPITGLTTYTLSCSAFGGGTPIDELENVNVTPTYQEL